MIIVSQNKDAIINFDNIAHIFINNGSKTTISYGKMNGLPEELGYYETKERTKEVLQEIIEIHRVAIPTAVYEMPKE